jgi:hypothetical protein
VTCRLPKVDLSVTEVVYTTKVVISISFDEPAHLIPENLINPVNLEPCRVGTTLLRTPELSHACTRAVRARDHNRGQSDVANLMWPI